MSVFLRPDDIPSLRPSTLVLHQTVLQHHVALGCVVTLCTCSARSSALDLCPSRVSIGPPKISGEAFRAYRGRTAVPCLWRAGRSDRDPATSVYSLGGLSRGPCDSLCMSVSPVPRLSCHPSQGRFSVLQVRTSTPTRSASRMCPTSNVGTGRGLRPIVRLSGREHQAFRRPRPPFVWTE